MGKSKIIGAVEIGTSKVVVLIGDVVNGRSLSIIGMGQCSSRGVIKGDILDFKQASDCTHAAIIAAEEQAKTSIEGVYLAQSGGHIEGFFNQAGLNVRSIENVVSREDITTVCQVAKAKMLPTTRTVIHHIRQPFRLDGRSVVNPEHLEGRHLEVGYWTVHGEVSKISDSIHIINGFSLHVDDLILASLASGVMVTSVEERQSGALVIDIGSGVTDFVLYRNGHVAMTGSLAVGGDHITNDLSLGLRIGHGQAEQIKVKHARAVVRLHDRAEKVWLNGDLAIGDRQIPRQAINQITAARVEEIFEIVKAEIGPELLGDQVTSGAVITGGGSRLDAICEAASKVLGLPARLGENPSWVKEELRGPEFSTILGLLNYGLKNQPDQVAEKVKKPGLLAKLFS
jgi:cell division protein FtsA